MLQLGLVSAKAMEIQLSSTGHGCIGWQWWVQYRLAVLLASGQHAGRDIAEVCRDIAQPGIAAAEQRPSGHGKIDKRVSQW